MMACTAETLLLATAWPCSIARVKAAAVAGWTCAQDWVATYPSTGRFSTAPWSRSASTCCPYCWPAAVM